MSEHISTHLVTDANIGVDFLAGEELSVPGNGILEACQFLVGPLLFLILHHVVDGVEEELYCTFSYLVLLVRLFFYWLEKQRVTTNIYIGKSEFLADIMGDDSPKTFEALSSSRPRMMATLLPTRTH